MARYWDDKDAHGKKLTDGRVCLVIESDDQNMPALRTYGRDKDEVLDKVARTAETAQAEIHRLRTTRNTPTTRIDGAGAEPPSVPARVELTADEAARATADLSNPAKSGEAVRTLLRGSGIDVDQMKRDADVKRVAAVAQEWERQHPEFPPDDRNKRLLMNTATLMVGFVNIDMAAFEAAYRDLVENGMLYETAEAEEEVTNPPVPPNGSSESRTARTRSATSYRRNSLNATVPVVQPEKPKFTRAEIHAMSTKTFQEKILDIPENSAWYNREFSAKATA